MLYSLGYLLLAVITAQLVLVSYVFEDEAKPVFPDYVLVGKSLGLGLIWPVLVVIRLALRAQARWDVLGKLDIPVRRDFDWNPAPNLLGVARRVAAGAVARVVAGEEVPAPAKKKAAPKS